MLQMNFGLAETVAVKRMLIRIVALFTAKLYTIPGQERYEISGTQAGRHC
jgi:hypothetical protein